MSDRRIAKIVHYVDDQVVTFGGDGELIEDYCGVFTDLREVLEAHKPVGVEIEHVAFVQDSPEEIVEFCSQLSIKFARGFAERAGPTLGIVVMCFPKEQPAADHIVGAWSANVPIETAIEQMEVALAKHEVAKQERGGNGEQSPETRRAP